MSFLSSWRPVFGCLLFVVGIGNAALAPAANPSTMPANRARVYVIQGATQGVADLVVYVNGRYVESVRANTYFTFLIAPGKHEITIASSTRATLPLSVSAGGTYYVSHFVNKDGMFEMRVISEAEARPLLAQYRPYRRDAATETRPPAAKAPEKVEAQPPPAREAPPAAATAPPTRAARPRTEEGRWYVGAMAAVAKAKDAAPCGQFAVALTGGFTCRFREQSGAFGLFGGYRLSRNLAIEAGYLDLGKYTAEANDATTAVSAEVTVDGIAGDVVATMPVSPTFGLLARAGILRWNVDDTFVLNGVSDSASKSGTSLHVGLGVALALSKTVELRGTYEKFKDVGDQDVTSQSDIDLLAASLVYRFR